MDFSTHQDKAKSKTFWLILLYLVGVLLIAFVAVLVVDAILNEMLPAQSETIYDGSSTYQGSQPGAQPGTQSEAYSGEYPTAHPVGFLDIVSSQRFAFALLGLSVFLAITGIYKYSALRSGGKNVAESIGARLITPQTTDFHERRVLNVVEEMSIASGVPVPPVYLLENELGINAFAAGYTLQDAVIGVTRGTISRLTREELQAVIAHEFSHIFNGDMRLNLRFTALLFGLLCLITIAKLSLRISARASLVNSRDNSRIRLVILLVSIVLYIAGSITAFWGRIIQAAINRQREYLADASAVQFTRSPAIASALKKIGGANPGSQLTSAMADSYSHFFFCRIDNSLLSTHPPLAKRILRIDPTWNGEYTVLPPEYVIAPEAETNPESTRGRRRVGGIFGAHILARNNAPAEPEAVLETQPDNEAEAVEKLHAACHEPLDACYVMFSLLLDDKPEIQTKQLAMIKNSQTLRDYKQALQFVPVQERLELIEKAVPALKLLSEQQYGVFQASLLKIIQVDEVFSFDEWIIYQLIIHQVGAQYKSKIAHVAKYTDINQVKDAVAPLLSALAWLTVDEKDAQGAFTAGLQAMELPTSIIQEKPDPAVLSESLEKLRQSSEEIRRKFLQSALQTAEFDKKIGAEDTAFLHVVSLCLDSPISPVA